ncbi:hypothetical protein M407DRAFT_30665 [Tulasnella calospora MUT 4182]|uniref:Uncharacterized protein n=1 Tax=Tulasnella calospora MUT 4182 TaxID=1051891 RepID=A0A0C3KE19_9AGAM|nr:hypothetical protein M407DRAFT_30665 [Tulasnella calospora MUT 4182]
MPSAKPHYPIIHPTRPALPTNPRPPFPFCQGKTQRNPPPPPRRASLPHHLIVLIELSRPTLRTNSHDHPFAMPHALQSTAVDSRSTTAFGMPLVHSPLSLEGEQQLNAMLKGGVECEPRATVKMNVDDLASGKNKTPFRQGQTRCDLRRA